VLNEKNVEVSFHPFPIKAFLFLFPFSFSLPWESDETHGKHGNSQYIDSYPVGSPGFVARRAKMEIMSWDTHGGLQRQVQQLLDD